MTTTMTQTLVNIALVLLFSTLWSRLDGWLERHHPAHRLVGLGLAGGLTTIALMQFPVTVAPGVFLDLRASAIAVCGLMGGPVSAVLAASMAVTWRVVEGGIGAGAGALAIFLAAGVGICAAWRHDHAILSIRRIVLMSIGLAIVPQITILVLPPETWPVVLNSLRVMLPMQCLAALISALMIRAELLQRAKLREADLYRSIIDAMPENLTVKNRDGHFILANPVAADLLGLSGPQEMIGKTDADFHPAALADQYNIDEQTVWNADRALLLEQSYETSSGLKGWYSTLKYPIREPQSGRIVGLVTHNRDISKQKELERQLAESRQQLTDALANMADGLVMFDRQGKLVYCNERYRAMFSKTADIRVPGADLCDIIAASRARGEEALPADASGAPAAPDRPEDKMRALPLQPGKREIQLWDGRTLEAQTRSVGGGGSLIVFTDITVAKQAEELLRHANRALEKAAFTDGLTGLYNRRAFDVHIRHELARTRRSGAGVCLLMIDIDHFKLFNDRYGHQAGDQCLRQVASALRSAAKRGTDIAARYGGEEMALLLTDTDLAGGEIVAGQYCQAVRDLRIPHEGSSKGFVTVSIGVAIAPVDCVHDSSDLIASADAALYRAKNGGRDRYVAAEPQPAQVETLTSKRANRG